MEEDIKILENYIREWNDTDVEQALQNLIARYKELEDKNKTLETLLQGNLYQMYLYYKELAGRYQANSISKDKVKEKIEELKGTEELLSDEQGYWGSSDLLAKIEVLQDLLERSREDV